MKIKLSKDRRILSIRNDEFTLTLGDRSNAEYQAILAPLGINIEFTEENPLVVGQHLALDKLEKIHHSMTRPIKDKL